MRAAIVVGVAACFSPTPPAGAPCADNGSCPSGQRCIASTCTFDDAAVPLDIGGGGSDGPDGSSVQDRDGDGVADGVDNCPDIANADQGDEDGDNVGDVCDPCPVDPNNDDGDGDGVGDACDPHPETPGDALVLFEGFHGGLPAGWQKVGQWKHNADDVVVSDPNSAHPFLAPPTVVPAHATVSVQVTIDQVLVGDANCDVQLDLPLDADQNAIDCNLFQNAGGRSQNLFDDFTGTNLGFSDLAWSAGTPYKIAIQRGMSPDYLCQIIDANGGNSIVTADPPPPTDGTVAGIGGFGITLRVSWMMIVSSP